jgi:EmrB/QacA subfamily drug resistance transporter
MAGASKVGGRPEQDPPGTYPDTLPEPALDVHAGKSKWWVLTAMVLGMAMPMLDSLALNFALPSLQRPLEAGTSDLRWFVDAYTLSFVSLMLIGGWVGDLFGRKRFLMLGLVVFLLGSLACGLAISAEQLIAFRAAQGLGAALVIPGSLSILAATFTGEGRGAAMGIWAAVSGLAVAAGPLMGAYIVEHYAWSSIFLINIPVGIVAVVLTALVVRESKDPTSARRINLPGLFTGTGSIGFLVYALVAGASIGWTDEEIFASFALAAVLLIAFLIIDATWKSPMLPLSLFRSPTFTASNLVSAAVFFLLFGATLLLAQYLQNEGAFSSSGTWVRLMPFIAAVLVISPIAGETSERRGSRGLMAAGCALGAAGMALLLRAEPDSSFYIVMLPASVLLGAGLGLTLGPMTTAVMGSAGGRHAGVASGATNTFRGLGGVLGIALLGTVVTTAFKNRLLTNLLAGGIASSDIQAIVDKAPSNPATAGVSVETFRQQLPAGVPGEVIDQVVSAVQQSFVEALHTGTLIAIGFMLLAAIVAAIFARSHVLSQAQVMPGPSLRPEEPARASTEVPRPVQAEAETSESLLRAGIAGPIGASQPGQAQKDVTPVGSVKSQEAHPGEEAPSDRPEKKAPEALNSLLFELPFKAGESTVQQNLAEFIEGILPYLDDALVTDAGAATLPPGVADSVRGRTSRDIAVVSGYLLLERRLGRLRPETHLEQAATLLMGAARALKLWHLPESDGAMRGDFVHGIVNIVLEGIGDSNSIQTADRPAAGQDALPSSSVLQTELKESPVLELPEAPEERAEGAE